MSTINNLSILKHCKLFVYLELELQYVNVPTPRYINAELRKFFFVTEGHHRYFTLIQKNNRILWLMTAANFWTLNIFQLYQNVKARISGIFPLYNYLCLENYYRVYHFLNRLNSWVDRWPYSLLIGYIGCLAIRVRTQSTQHK